MTQPFTTRPEIQGTFGVVTSTHWLASAAGMAMLERGGNAFDAAVAAGFVLQIVEPHLNGPGGEVPVIFYSAGSGRTEMLQPSTGLRRGDTCHLDVIDRHGNMVSATPSGGWLQSSPAIPELGFCLTTRGQMFWLEEGAPAALGPGKRPRTTLTPSLALRDGEPYLAFGTPGGDQQDQWQMILFLRHVHHGLSLQESIDAPLFHTQHAPSSFYPRAALPGSLTIEASFPDDTIRELERRGHELTVTEPWTIGRLTAAARDGAILKAAATPRLMQAYAIGR